MTTYKCGLKYGPEKGRSYKSPLEHGNQSRIDGVDETVQVIHHLLDLLGVSLYDQFLRLRVMSDA